MSTRPNEVSWCTNIVEIMPPMNIAPRVSSSATSGAAAARGVVYDVPFIGRMVAMGILKSRD